ncbi:TonB-dependent receptor [Tahibacter harae]|uniref:TonB-dependent receptor n=1 Tax=Tahibacter harae TaxID=2963937 RepID=A0ABT1QXN3_9GAMM|nr:TonB-dependent receptor [Tahibacter harae]MCQ4167055.1 TonB-dependent receptor [Tahibacter harae]
MKRNYLALAIGCVLLAPMAWANDSAESTAETAAETAAADSPDGAADSKATTLDQVTVTARKREETLQDVPVAVTAFTADAMEKLNVEDIGDLDAQVPNLTVYAARGSSSTVTAYIRGIGQSDPLWGVDPGVGIYLDDVYIARPQGALLDVFDVDRVEVLRGPQGTLYGKNTIGGAIKYISKSLPKEAEGYAQLTVGSYGQLDAKGALGGPIGGSDSPIRARLAVASLNRDGFGENLTNGAPVSDKEINAFRASIGADVNERFDLLFAFDWMDDQSGVRGAKMLAPNRFAPTVAPLSDRYDIRSGMPNVNDTKMKGASGTANWRATDSWAFKYVFARRDSDTETNIDFDTLPNKIADVKAFYRDEQTTNELQANFDGGGKARGVMGLYHFDGEAGGQVLNNFFNASFGDTQGTVYTKAFAAYADWTFDFTDRLSLDAGARWTDEEKHAVVLNRGYTDATFTVPTTTVANFNRKVDFTNVSPKLALDYKLSDTTMLYGVASRGFKSGGFNIRANSVAVPRSAEPFDDEKVDSYEIGTKMALAEQSLFLNFAYFYNKYEDIQLSVFTAFDSNGDGTDDAFFGDFTNAGRGHVQGLEMEYQWLPNEHWLLSGNLAWLDAKYDEFITSGVDVSDSQKFTNAPRFSGAVNLEYRTELASGGNLSTRVGYSYQSEVWPTTDLSPVIRQDGYGLLNAGVIWRLNPSLSFSLQGTNLTDKAYRTTGYNIPVLGVLTGFYGPPRQYTLSARYDF